MLVTIGDEKAKCAECGSVEFFALSRSELRPEDELACSGCGKKAAYGDLLDSIGDDAVRRIHAALEALKKERKDHHR